MMTNEQRVRACAEKVMGWEVYNSPSGNTLARFMDPSDGRIVRCLEHRHGIATGGMWNPYTSDDHAFMLVDKLLAMGWRFRLQAWAGEWLCEVWPIGVLPHEGHIYSGLGDRRTAIVLAALRAVGQEGE